MFGKRDKGEEKVTTPKEPEVPPKNEEQLRRAQEAMRESMRHTGDFRTTSPPMKPTSASPEVIQAVVPPPSTPLQPGVLNRPTQGVGLSATVEAISQAVSEIDSLIFGETQHPKSTGPIQDRLASILSRLSNLRSKLV